MSGNHFGHDGRKYFSIKARDEADKAFDKTAADAKRKGKGNSHCSGTDDWSKQEWDDWIEQWHTRPWNNKKDPSRATTAAGGAYSIAIADGKEIIKRYDCGRFACKDSNEGFFGGVAC